ncbi:MAG: four helix bundle protein [Candidatus Shapirobacteria bacterium]|jgi:four helix bundle protein
MENKTIKSFTDLLVWRQAHELVLEIYKVTKTFPTEEKYGLTDQIRRAAISITSNIAEGFSRGGYKEKCQFYYMSLGSLTEVQNQLLVARDVGYISSLEFNRMAEKTISVQKLLNRFISTTKSFI